jgi:hypothetical protein
MSRKLRPRSIYDVFAVLALVVALGGTSAWATHEVINSSDVVDDSLTGADIKNSSLTGQDVFDNTISGADITNGSLTGADVFDNTIGGADITNGSLTGAKIANESIGFQDIGSQEVGSDEVVNNSLLSSDLSNSSVGSDEVTNFSLGNGDFLTGSVNSRVVTDNELTGADINELALDLSSATTATFAGPASPVSLSPFGTFHKVASKNLPAGSWAISATANTFVDGGPGGVSTAVCELRHGTSFIGGATDRRYHPSSDDVNRSLSMNGGAQIATGGAEVSLWCKSETNPSNLETVTYAQMMMIRVGGFS